MELKDGKNKKEKKAKEPKAPKAKSAAMGKAKLTVIICAVIVALVFAAAAGGVIYVGTIDEIYPNVSLDGNDLSGMSLTEAAAELGELGYFSQEGKALDVYLPLDFSLHVEAEEVCSETPVAELVERVDEAIRGGNPVEDALTYLKCRFSGMALESDILITVDTDAVRAKVDNVVRDLNLELMSSDVQIAEDNIVVIKGAKGITIDNEEIVSLISAAFVAEDYSDITYEAEIHTDEELDIEQLYSTVACEPENARYDKVEGKIVEHIVGIDFDREEALRLWNEAGYGDEVEIPFVKTEPEVTTEEFEELLFRDKLGECKTSKWGSAAGRVNNMKKAIESVNGIILLPGEEFSYNDALGKRTPENGYMLAGAYSGGQTVQEYGGGICQISSMVYYSALHANLKITDRTCHYFAVGYVPTGLDATVSWGGPEFKFVNSRDFPIKIVAWMEDDTGDIYVEIWGSDIDGSYVVMTCGTWYFYDTTHTEVALGYRAQSYRNVYDAEGNLISKTEESFSQYNFHEEDIKWPEESPSPTPTPSTTPAPEATPTPPAETATPAPTPTPAPPAETPVPPAETPVPPPATETPETPPVTETPPADTPAE